MEQLGEPSRFFREPTQSYSVQASFVVKEAGTGDEGTHLVEVGSFTHKRGAVLLCRLAMAGLSSPLSINRISRLSRGQSIAARGLSSTNTIGRLSRVVLSGYVRTWPVFSGVFRTHALFSGDIRTLPAHLGDIRTLQPSRMAKCRPKTPAMSGFCPKSSQSPDPARECSRCPNPRSVLIPPDNAVAAICPAMRYTALRTAVSWKQKVSGRCRDSVCSNILPLLSKVWLVMTAR